MVPLLLGLAYLDADALARGEPLSTAQHLVGLQVTLTQQEPGEPMAPSMVRTLAQRLSMRVRRAWQPRPESGLWPWTDAQSRGQVGHHSIIWGQLPHQHHPLPAWVLTADHPLHAVQAQGFLNAVVRPTLEALGVPYTQMCPQKLHASPWIAIGRDYWWQAPVMDSHPHTVRPAVYTALEALCAAPEAATG